MKILYVIPNSIKENSFIFFKREAQLIHERHNQEVELYFLKYSINPIKTLSEIICLRKKILNSNFDIIHAQYGTITSLITAIASYRKKFVITFRGADINGSPDVSKTRECISLFFSWSAMRFADTCIFVSNNLKNKSPHLCSASYVIPTGVDDSSFFMIDQEKCRNELNLSPEKKYVLFYSSFNSPNKRTDLAVGALGVLHSNGHKHIDLLTIDGGITPELMPTYLNAVDALLMVSDYEGSPTMVQEAVACGTPVVSVEVGDVREVLNGINNSIIVERKHESIAEGILFALNKGKGRASHTFFNFFALNQCVKILFKSMNEF